MPLSAAFLRAKKRIVHKGLTVVLHKNFTFWLISWLCSPGNLKRIMPLVARQHC